MKQFSNLCRAHRRVLAVFLSLSVMLLMFPMMLQFNASAAIASPTGYNVTATYNSAASGSTGSNPLTDATIGAGANAAGARSFSQLNTAAGNLLFGKGAVLSGKLTGGNLPNSSFTWLVNIDGTGTAEINNNFSGYTDGKIWPSCQSRFDFALSGSAVKPLDKSGSVWVKNDAFSHSNYSQLDALDTYLDITYDTGGSTVFDSVHIWDHWGAGLQTYLAQVFVGNSAADLNAQTAEDAVLTFFNEDAKSGSHFTFSGASKPTGRFLRVRVYSPNTPGSTQAALNSRVSEIAAFGTTTYPEYPDLGIYQEDLYLSPVWTGNVVYQETAMFYTGRDEISLLYPIKDIVAVRSYDLNTLYEEGVDYTVTIDGKLNIENGSGIPVYTGDTNAQISNAACPAHQISVTYTHDEVWQDGYDPGVKPEPQLDKLTNLHNKLKNKQKTNIVFYGDSIMVGWNASGLNQPTLNWNALPSGKTAEALYNAQPNYVASMNIAPYMPSWPNMVVDSLKSTYGYSDIHMINKAVGSTYSSWGAAKANIDFQFKNTNPDLVVIGFGMNEAATLTGVADYKTNILNMINNILTDDGTNGDVYYPDAEFLLVSRMTRADSAIDAEVLAAIETALLEIAAGFDNVAVAPVASMFENITESKEYIDYTGNNVNHPNDFGARIYAQTVLSVLRPVGYSYTVEYSTTASGWSGTDANVFTGTVGAGSNGTTNNRFFGNLGYNNGTDTTRGKNLLYGKSATLSGMNAGASLTATSNAVLSDASVYPTYNGALNFANSKSTVKPLINPTPWQKNVYFNAQDYFQLNALDTYQDFTFDIGEMTVFNSVHMWDHWNHVLRTGVAQVFIADSVADLDAQTAQDAVITFTNEEVTSNINNGYHFTFVGESKPTGQFLRVRIYSPNMPGSTQAALNSRITEIAAFGSKLPPPDIEKVKRILLKIDQWNKKAFPEADVYPVGSPDGKIDILDLLTIKEMWLSYQP